MKPLTFIVAIIFILLITVSIFSQEKGRIHIVRSGDTLWDLSQFYLRNPVLWPSIWEANKANIADPHWIYPGQSFLIPPTVSQKGKVYYTPFPGKKEERVTKVEAVAIALPIVANQLAFKAGYLTNDKIETGYIVESEPKKQNFYSVPDTNYIDLGENERIQVGDMFTIFRWGKKVKDPKSGKNLGKIVNVLGKLAVIKVSENSSVCIISQSFDFIKKHDMIMPFIPQEIPLLSILETPGTLIEGYIASPKIEGKTITPFDIVYINLGEADGISAGDYFEIIRKGPVVSDPGPKRKVKLPETRAGGLQVLRTTKESSTCYITQIFGNMDIKQGELIRLKGKCPGTTLGTKYLEEKVEEIIGPE